MWPVLDVLLRRAYSLLHLARCPPADFDELSRAKWARRWREIARCYLILSRTVWPPGIIGSTRAWDGTSTSSNPRLPGYAS